MDKEILRQAIIETAEEGVEVDVVWDFYDDGHPALFAQRSIRRYFEILRIELAKDGN